MRRHLYWLLLVVPGATGCAFIWSGTIGTWCSHEVRDEGRCDTSPEDGIRHVLDLVQTSNSRSSVPHCVLAYVAKCKDGGQMIRYGSGFTGWSEYFDAEGRLRGADNWGDVGPPFGGSYGLRFSCGDCEIRDLCPEALAGPDGGSQEGRLTPRCPD